MPTTTKFGAEGAAALAGALAGNEKVKNLIISGCDIGDEGAAAFSQVIAVNKTLEELNLCENGIGNEGAAKLADGLRSAVSLQQLLLDNNPSLGDSGAVALAGALKANKTLVRLHLYLGFRFRVRARFQ